MTGKEIEKKEKVYEEDVFLETKEDRRLLPNVPDDTQKRSNIDRRGKGRLDDSTNVNDFIKASESGIRYKVNYKVKVIFENNGVKGSFYCKGIDISMTGILLEIYNEEDREKIETADSIKLNFEIIPGTMPEGMEMTVKTEAKIARSKVVDRGRGLYGLQFKEELSIYSRRKKDGYILTISGILLFFITAFIVLMRAESVIYFRFNKWLYLYSIIAAFFLLSRYLFAVFYKSIPIDTKFTPGVTIIIPCFNEEKWIQKTILSCINQDYPIEKLEVIVVDDCSTDKSAEKIKEIVHKLYEENDFKVKDRLKYILMKENGGKREALSKGVLEAKHDLIVFVDSDSFLNPFAIRNLVQPFKDSKIGGVAGRTDVANTYTNNLTKIQSVRYYIAFRIMKAAESIFDTVTCLSGPLSCYRKEIILENMDSWLNQQFFGQKATFGDDRAMTNFVLRKYRTSYQDSAICYTIVPNDHKVFLKQQMRWKRSWLRESLIASKFMWKKEPLGSLTFYIGVMVPVFAPIVVIYNLLYVPIVHRIFPTTFLVGLLLMAMLMSTVQLLLRKSTTWVFGILFCIYYEAVLLWQMPIAWFTFWKSTWGTRMTPSDVDAQLKKDKKRLRKARNV
ncbi:glycosyltransferase [Tissierella pigra]|uniref:Hyaluronan synthase n=1 Tax=Tissierella pigra TaxID=2607614 RepID=A0A6N7XZM9_9FIRM|nr:glycosyltransferase [Tissierella pigra]MSU02044.1 glycosyltransferase [Tissierella pigra]